MNSMTDTRVLDRNATIDLNAPSGLSWPSIIAGALTAIAVSLILVMLGSALELSSISPWSYTSGSPGTFAAKTVIWLIIMQWVASGFGGYIAGRLRTKWVGMHTDEVFFRDTAHGFLTWALATVVMALFLASATSSVISGGVRASATVASGAAMGASQPAGSNMAKNFNDPMGYYVDTMFRMDTPNPNVTNDEEMRAETARILANAIKNDGVVPDSDKNYLAQLIVVRTGVSLPDASKRVDAVISQLNDAKQKALQTAEDARKTSLKLSVYIFLSLLIGAFVASCAGALGGKLRDEY